MRRIDLSSGINAILINFLRQKGGCAEVLVSELSKENRKTMGSISGCISFLEKHGFVKRVGKQGKTPIIELDEEAIRAYENRAQNPRISSDIPCQRKGKRNQPFGGVPNYEVERLLQNLSGQKFLESSVVLVNPLFEVAKDILAGYKKFSGTLRSQQEDVDKLGEALSGFGMDKREIMESINITAEEIASIADYQDLPAVPTINFPELISEPSAVFKPLATLQAKTKILRSILVELQREHSRLGLLKQKLSNLLKEKQETQVAEEDVMMNFGDWRRHSDRYFQKFNTAGVAVVSSRD